MKPNHTKQLLSEANAYFQKGAFDKAVQLYELARLRYPELKRYVDINVQIAKRRKARGRGRASDPGRVVRLVPTGGLEPDSTNGRRWIAITNDPHFEVFLSAGGNLEVGWYEINILINSENQRGIAKFYLDCGRGYSEKESIEIPFLSGERAKRVFCLKETVASVRFDPMETEGEFEIAELQWNPISEEYALVEILKVISPGDECAERLQKGVWARALNKLDLSVDGSAAEQLLDAYNKKFIPRQPVVDYPKWIRMREKAGNLAVDEVRFHIKSFKLKPLISIILPTYNTPERFLRECIESVMAQSYWNWELCIADDASTSEHVRRVITEYANADSRIKYVFREDNGHISKASNTAISVAAGGFLAFLDHDDLLVRDALYYMVESINKDPNAVLIYSDEDKIDEQGIRFDPHFKSDWNPDLFFSHNYICHFVVIKKEIVEKVGGFRVGVEGSQDYDLLLRCLPYIKDSQIVHVPRILYHWRVIEGSTALNPKEKMYTTDAGLKALSDYFRSVQPSVKVECGPVPNTYRTRWPIPEASPLVSLIIPTRDCKDLVEVAVRSIISKTSYKNYEILIIDNGSTCPETLRFFNKIVLEDCRVRVIRYDRPFNYSSINNYAVRFARGSLLGLVNNDIEVIAPEWLTEMVSHAIRDDIGCVGAKLFYSNGTIQHGGVICSIGGVAGHSHKYFPRDHYGYFSRLVLTQNLSAVTAACMLVKKSIFLEVGGLDEKDLSVAFNDVDLCLKVLSAGYRNIWTPYAELYHHESVSRGKEDTPEKQRRFQSEVAIMKSRWGEFLQRDPYYNPNLTRVSEDFSLGM